MTTQQDTFAGTDSVQHLHHRVRAEFAEMPGLRLTVRQASRLFHLDSALCERVLRELVGRGDLTTDGSAFVHVGSGRYWY